MDLDAYEQAGLYDPADPEAAKRRALLAWLEVQGTSIEQMQRSASYGALSSAAGDALIRPGAPITLVALAERVGLPEERILEILRAAGASSASGESQTFVESDAETFALFKAAAGLFSGDAVLEITRVMGNAMARVAEAAITLFQVNIEAPLAQQLDDQELTDLIEDFERRANDIVTRFDGRVVKHIGDEVMFIAVGAAAACHIALAAAEAFRGSGVEPHGGLAIGPLLTRGGDFYGPIVNLASRVGDIAIPGEILVTEDVMLGGAEDPDLSFEPAGRRMLKGFADPVPLWTLS